MTLIIDRLRLIGLIQELQREAATLGLTRTAAALEVTGAVATEEISDPRGAADVPGAPMENQEPGPAD